jgi:hypothetical protein
MRPTHKRTLSIVPEVAYGRPCALQIEILVPWLGRASPIALRLA